MFVGKIEKDTFGFATFLLKLFKTGFGLSVSGYPKCILNVSYIGAPFVFSCHIISADVLTMQIQWLRGVLHSPEDSTQTRKMKFAARNPEI